MVGTSKDIGSHLNAVIAHSGGVIVAGGGADGAEVNGDLIDTQGFDSGVLLIAYEAALASSKTLTVAVQLQHGDDSDAGDIEDLAATYDVTSRVLTEAETATKGVLAIDIDVSRIKRYFRVQVTPTLSASGTDTAEVTSVLVLGGASDLPAAETLRQRVPAAS